MSQSFTSKKRKILDQLAIPDQDYIDLSPKGSVDEGIRELVNDINLLDGFVTTSSCAGRVAAYLEGISKHSQNGGQDERPAGIASGGKGGGQWLFVSHDPLDLEPVLADQSATALLGLDHAQAMSCPATSSGSRFVHLKFEPMILHILTASPPQAQQVLSAALSAGFRESGISSITSDGTIMVAVRTAGLAFDSIVAYMNAAGTLVPMVSDEYMRTLLQVANDRFMTNSERKERFRQGLLVQVHGKATTNGKGKDWEPAEQRRERKRAEGLQRKAELERAKPQADDGAQRQGLDESLGLPQSIDT